jgi:hypothetical protein
MKKIFFSILVLCCISTVRAQQIDTTFKEYTGRYVFPEGSVVADVTVALEGDALTMASSAGTSSLTKLGVDSFSIVEFSGTAVFKRNENSKIHAVHIEAGGYILDGAKEEAKGWSFRVYQKPSDTINTVEE